MYQENTRANYGINQQAMEAKMQACATLGGQMLAPNTERGQVEVAIDVTSSAIDSLEYALVVLRDRLKSVLQPEYPQPCSAVGEQKAGPPCSPAVQYLQSQRSRIQMLESFVRDISARLDA